MTQAFVDTGGWYALLVSEDVRHELGVAVFRRARAEQWELVTTDAVLFETYALLINRARNGRNLALALIDKIERGGVTMVHVTVKDVTASIDLVQSHRDKSYSLCDASSFVVMDRLGIRNAIAFDEHFRQYGRINILE